MPPLDEYRWVLRRVRRFLRPSLDHEGVASAIWLECFETGVKPTTTIIHRRCIDQLRRLYRDQELLAGYKERLRSGSVPPYVPHVSSLSFLVEQAQLSSEELLTIHLWSQGHDLTSLDESLGRSQGTSGRLLQGALGKLKGVARKEQERR